jgi:hypothetical protein
MTVVLRHGTALSSTLQIGRGDVHTVLMDGRIVSRKTPSTGAAR